MLTESSSDATRRALPTELPERQPRFTSALAAEILAVLIKLCKPAMPLDELDVVADLAKPEIFRLAGEVLRSRLDEQVHRGLLPSGKGGGPLPSLPADRLWANWERGKGEGLRFLFPRERLGNI